MADVRVQGAAAARRIKWALGQLSQLDVDAVVLVRGGGSRADLAPFDTELVARAIAAMPVPVHHRRRARDRPQRGRRGRATPRARPRPRARRLLVRRVDEFVGRLDDAAQRVTGRARQRVAIAARELDVASVHLARRAPAAASRELAALDAPTGGSTSWRGDARSTPPPVSTAASAASTSWVAGRRATAAAVLTGRERELATRAGHHLDRATLRLDRQRGRGAGARSPAGAGAGLLHHPRRRRPGGAARRRCSTTGTVLETELAERAGHEPGRRRSRRTTRVTGDEIGYADAMQRAGRHPRGARARRPRRRRARQRVRRASELIQLCRGRIARAQADVDRIVTDLEGFERATVDEG